MYSVEQKKEVIDFIINNDISLYQAEKKFNISSEIIRLWLYKYKHGDIYKLKNHKHYRKLM